MLRRPEPEGGCPLRETFKHTGEVGRDLLGFVPGHSVTDTVLEAIDAWVAANRT